MFCPLLHSTLDLPGVTVNPLQSTGDYNFTTVNADNKNDYACNTSDQVSCTPGLVNYATRTTAVAVLSSSAITSPSRR